MNILVSTDETYVFQTLVMLESLFSTNEGDIKVYALLRNVNDRCKKWMKKYVEQRGHFLKIINIEDSDYGIIGADRYSEAIKSTHHLTMAAYNRLLCTVKLDEKIDRVIYLDSDMIITKSLSELYSQDLDEYAAAVVEGFTFIDFDYMLLANNDVERTKATIKFAQQFRRQNNIEFGAKYFNSGMMVINLDYLRKHDFVSRVKKHIMEHECTADADQSVLNVVIKDEVKYVPQIFNCRPSDYDKRNKAFLEMQPYILHYGVKPWNDYKTIMGNKWWKYAFKTDKKVAARMLVKCIKNTSE
ncbi:glycosyltransferase family 8 protein [Butyrivibrio sp. AD3002]|uniref:glycosyltransferase family 8 protein n=1 Tax=Butyrivibrio sp. AD3002 TaxID=1280670 RepID=UPI0003B4E3D5|nr:glycosyltransferase family 8 protein [Butyrivibrio sp. AD3002]